MKLKKLYLFLTLLTAFLWLGSGTAWGEELTIADDTGTNESVPVWGWQGDNYIHSQIIYPADSVMNPKSFLFNFLGSPQNNYEPKNLNAEVAGGDNVTFSWEADAQADRYVITLYCDGEFYSTLTVNGTSKVTTMPKDGTWSWTIQAFNQGSNGNYFEASNAVAGNDFVTKSAEIPEDAIELEVTGLNAFYIEPSSEFYQEGKNSWILQFGIANSGYNYAWFLVYTNQTLAISGAYNLTRGNLDDDSDLLVLESGDQIASTESEVRLTFDGFDEVEVTDSYSVTNAFYTGSFRLVGTDGKTYVGRFMELECNSGGFTNYYYQNPVEHITLIDEDPDYDPYQGIEDINVEGNEGTRKLLIDGQLYIIRENAIYNVSGLRVK